VSAQPSADAEQADRAKQARAAAGVAAKEITRDRARLEKSMTAVDAALAAHQVGTARRAVDGISGRFAALDGADFEPDEKADAETRGALSTASNLLSRYQHLKRAVEANEMLAFDAAFNTLWDPKNAQKDEDQLYANVGKKIWPNRRGGPSDLPPQRGGGRSKAQSTQRCRIPGPPPKVALNVGARIGSRASPAWGLWAAMRCAPTWRDETSSLSPGATISDVVCPPRRVRLANGALHD
jgi:hypothetical protein